ncbi:MAG TPA: hypothetical protein VN947_07390 [Polyangia bacterium]|nr:hypothetical protein [Polyangia bacterium]
MRNLCLALLFLASACGDDTTAAVDLGAPVDDLSVADLSVADLAVPSDFAVCIMPPPDGFDTPVDAGGFCAGTSIAGTCIATFFAQLSECFVPKGCCRPSGGGNSHGVTWQSGAGFYTFSGVDGDYYAAQNVACAFSTSGGVTPAGVRWTLQGGSTSLTITDGTYDVTCPDGSHINVGNPAGQCAELDRLLAPFATASCMSPPSSCCVPYVF